MNGISDIQEHMPRRFRNRREAGRLLATRLLHFANRRDVVILALPRGGVPVAYEVAVAIGAPLDVFTVRKLGVPGHEEFAMGAIGSGGAYVLNSEVIDALHIPHAQVEDVTERESKELNRREHLYRDSRPFPKLEGSTVILIDDGIATGASMIVAVKALQQKSPRKIVVAVPVAPPDVLTALRAYADEVIYYETPEPFGGVGAWYADFSQVTDDEVRGLLDQASLRWMS
jgi:putative phosphoribosyl transferase